MWHDRRNKTTIKMVCALVLAAFFMFVTAALANTGTPTESDDKTMFFAMFSIIQILIGYIYISGQRSNHADVRGVKESIAELKNDVKAINSTVTDLRLNTVSTTDCKDCPAKDCEG